MTMDVLLIESRPGMAAATATMLEHAGHHVHRCHDPGEPAFPCKALSEPDGCPLDRPVDVALLVRPRVAPRPTAVEDGVSCAVRAGVPVVEHGPDILDPFAPWLTDRVHRSDEVLDACTRAVEFAGAPLRRDVARRTSPLLRAAGIDDADVVVRLVRLGARLEVHLDLPGPLDRGAQHAVAVRALDAVRDAKDRHAGQTDVHVHAGPGVRHLTGT